MQSGHSHEDNEEIFFTFSPGRGPGWERGVEDDDDAFITGVTSWWAFDAGGARTDAYHRRQFSRV